MSSAIKLNCCNQFACQQFRYAANDVYIEQRVLNSIQNQIRAYERNIIENAKLVELIDQEIDGKADEKKVDEKKNEES